MKTSLPLAALSATTLGHCAILYENGTIIAFNEQTQSTEVLRQASMLIVDDRIAAVSNVSSDITAPDGCAHVDATGKIISPGFIDTHHHLWQTAFKTLGSNTSLADYFQKYSEFSPAEQYFTTDDLYVGQLTGILELLYMGTTTVLDHAHGSFSDEAIDACVNATFESGIRSFYADAIHILPNGYTWEDQVSKLSSLAKDPRFLQSDPSSLVTLGLAWDSFYIAPEQNVTELWNLTKSLNLSVVTTHYIGGPFSYTNSPTRLQEAGWLNDTVPIVFAHASFMDYGDAYLLRQTNQYVSTTPESELHFGHNHPYLHLIQDQASIGVDCHFTFSSSMVLQGRLWLQSLRAPNYLESLDEFTVPVNNPMSADQAFHLITRAGALSLRRDDLGVIRAGAKADIVTFRTDAPNMIGWIDPIAAIMLHSDVADIEDVLVNGKYVKQGGKMMYQDYAALAERLRVSADRIQSIWTQEIKWPELLVDETVGAAPYVHDAPVVDTLRGNGTGYGPLFFEDGATEV